jgi:hypothetical protein
MMFPGSKIEYMKTAFLVTENDTHFILLSQD